MPLPPLIDYPNESDYREHYKRIYCRGRIVTRDGIRIHFSPQRFEHAFYEGARKDRFSVVRARRIDWIKATLEHPDAALYQGWNKRDRCYEPDRRVSVVYEDFVVVVSLSFDRHESLRGQFVTCYQADNSIGKIRRSPLWSLEECLEVLRRKGGR